MKILVTGVAGFVGSSIAERLLADGNEVVGIDCFTDYYPRPLKEENLKNARQSQRFSFIEADLVSLDLEKLLREVEVVYHQAAQAGVRASWGATFSSYAHHNIMGTQHLLEAAKDKPNLKRIVYASSSSVYGNAERYPTKESDLPQPVSPYGVTKLGAEHLMSLYASEFGVPTISLRYFTVYGPRQRPDMAFNRFIRMGLRGQSLTLYGDGQQSRDFTYIDDIVEANLAASQRGTLGGAYNLGGGSEATVNQVLEIIGEIVGPLKVTKLDRQKGDARRTTADTNRAKAELGFAPKISLKAGIEKEAGWMEGVLTTPLAKYLE